MRLLTVTNLPPVYGGAEVMSQALVLASRTRLDASIVVTAHTQVAQTPAGCPTLRVRHAPGCHAHLAARGIEVLPLLTVRTRAYVSRKRAKPSARLVRQLAELISRHDVDVVHDHFVTGSTRETLDACHLTGVPLVLTLHAAMDLVPRPDHRQRLPYDATERLELAARASHRVVVSREVLDLCRAHGLSGTTLIPNGVDRRAFAPRAGQVRSGILYVGKNNQIKGLATTVAAYTRIAAHVDADLTLVGRGISRAAFAAAGFGLDAPERSGAEKLLQAGRIHLRDEIPHDAVRELQRAARVLVLPSRTEAMPMVVLEALSCGTPVIASRVGALPEIVRAGDNGLLVEPEDAGAVARAMLDTLVNPDRFEPRACRESVARFGIEAAVDAHLGIFQAVSQHCADRHRARSRRLTGAPPDARFA